MYWEANGCSGCEQWFLLVQHISLTMLLAFGIRLNILLRVCSFLKWNDWCMIVWSHTSWVWRFDLSGWSRVDFVRDSSISIEPDGNYLVFSNCLSSRAYATAMGEVAHDQHKVIVMAVSEHQHCSIRMVCDGDGTPFRVLQSLSNLKILWLWWFAPKHQALIAITEMCQPCSVWQAAKDATTRHGVCVWVELATLLEILHRW